MSSFSHTDKSVQSQEQSVVAQPTRDTQTAQTAQPDAHTHAQASEPAKTSEPAIEFIDAEVQRAHRVIWSHGNFSIPTGSVTAIVGTNGTGKTTMLSTELGIIPLSSGRLRVLGAAPGKKNARIGYVPQNYTSINESNITVFDFVLLGISGSRWGFLPSSHADRQAVDDILDFVGLMHKAQSRIRDLSGGQRQRAAIAQALVNKPELLILDEPLANLDIASQHSIVELLAELNKRTGMTIQVVAHDLNVLLPILTGAVYLLDGHPHYSSMNNMLDSNLLTHLYGTTVEVITTPQGDMFVTHNSDVEPPSRTVHDEHPTQDAAQWHSPHHKEENYVENCAGEQTDIKQTEDIEQTEHIELTEHADNPHAPAASISADSTSTNQNFEA
ncbi:ABC transporter ATP-binding protein [Alloscardovia omnicolens]|uniref:ABC transporter ATP-binding protein n=1 Tax=Alloscardovia omnicolens TaxID=419015 RepID=A0A2I1M7L2_9BIFI|nr:ABC transporter ATP-binding protein [Alloscardovia omnicolens]MDU6533050.1 ATP-binding cassette domain-containing protein [Alloscardovia omnicolens]PKZ16121.1 ABC transporter ATP-binding protein [Alloscardovia omnicolens]